MTGRRYYLTTIGAWRRHAEHCAETHFVALNAPAEQSGDGGIGAQLEEATADRNRVPVEQTQVKACSNDGTQAEARLSEHASVTDETTQILALIDADEGAHLAMENDAKFEALPHPLARTAVSQRVSGDLAHFGIAPGDDTFTVAEKVARVNPLLRHRVF